MDKPTGKRNNALLNILLVTLVVGLVAAPLLFKKGSDFSGADGLAEEAIGEINRGYQPWFKPIWEPPSGEVESLLFSLQAALGAGFIGYYLGYVRGRARKEGTEKG